MTKRQIRQMVISDPLDSIRIKPKAEKSGVFDADDMPPLLNGARTKEEGEDGPQKVALSIES